jgi:hypothetical protein
MVANAFKKAPLPVPVRRTQRSESADSKAPSSFVGAVKRTKKPLEINLEEQFLSDGRGDEENTPEGGSA